MDRKLASLLLGILFVIVGIVLTIIGMNGIRNAKESLHWPTTDGTIISSEMDMKRAKSGTEKASHYEYRPKIVYSYNVSGTAHTSNKVATMNPMSRKSQEIKPILQRYKAGNDVTVYYNPDEPAMAVLEPGVTKSTYIPLGLGIVFLLVGAGFVVAGLLFSKS